MSGAMGRVAGAVMPPGLPGGAGLQGILDNPQLLGNPDALRMALVAHLKKGLSASDSTEDLQRAVNSFVAGAYKNLDGPEPGLALLLQTKVVVEKVCRCSKRCGLGDLCENVARAGKLAACTEVA